MRGPDNNNVADSKTGRERDCGRPGSLASCCDDRTFKRDSHCGYLALGTQNALILPLSPYAGVNSSKCLLSSSTHHFALRMIRCALRPSDSALCAGLVAISMKQMRLVLLAICASTASIDSGSICSNTSAHTTMSAGTGSAEHSSIAGS